MSEETTTSSSRIFVKILFQELCAYMGLPRLNQRLKDMYERTLRLGNMLLTVSVFLQTFLTFFMLCDVV